MKTKDFSPNPSNNKKNIVLVGLIYDDNLGDQAIYKCCLNNVREYINYSDVEIRALDLYGRKYGSSGFYSLLWRACNRINKVLLRNRWDICGMVARECDKAFDANTAACIVTGGGLIEYKYQMIAEPLITAIEKANGMDIPVMLSSVGVEGYDDRDERCQSLKAALNLPCVKMITTRDDLDTLQKKYIYNRNISSYLVADVACSISDVYPKNKKRSRTIGCGVGRADLFQDYGNNSSECDIKNFWFDFFDKAILNGYDCAVFTNGAKSDQKFAKRIVHEYASEKVRLMERPKKLHDLIGIINRCTAVVVTRLHASIISYSYGIPFVGLVWNDKQKFFGKSIDRESAFIDEGDMNGAYVWQALMHEIAEARMPSPDYIKTTKKHIFSFLDEVL